MSRFFVITADHQAYGKVSFYLKAADKKDAFNKFKGIVFNSKQWIVISNLGDEENQSGAAVDLGELD